MGVDEVNYRLFTVYPTLAGHIDALCDGARWCITGASALVQWGDAYLFELTKPKHWRSLDDGSTVVGIGGIGGSVESDEAILECLHREIDEEVGVPARVTSADETHLVYEGRVFQPVALKQREMPRPALFTISENLYRQHVRPECEILAIVTFIARLQRKPALRDLYGLIAVPKALLPDLLGPDRMPIHRARDLTGIEIVTKEPLPRKTILEPVWTVRTLQLLLRRGYHPLPEEPRA